MWNVTASGNAETVGKQVKKQADKIASDDGLNEQDEDAVAAQLRTVEAVQFFVESLSGTLDKGQQIRVQASGESQGAKIQVSYGSLDFGSDHGAGGELRGQLTAAERARSGPVRDGGAEISEFADRPVIGEVPGPGAKTEGRTADAPFRFETRQQLAQVLYELRAAAKGEDEKAAQALQDRLVAGDFAVLLEQGTASALHNAQGVPQ